MRYCYRRAHARLGLPSSVSPPPQIRGVVRPPLTTFNCVKSHTEEQCEAFKAKLKVMKWVLSPAGIPPLDNVGLLSKLFEIAKASLAQRQQPAAPQPC